MRTEQETGRRALSRFRLPYLLMIPNARKNVREIKGKQNFFKKNFQKKVQISGFQREKKNNSSLDDFVLSTRVDWEALG